MHFVKALKKCFRMKKGIAYYKQKAIERGEKFDAEQTVKAVEDMLWRL